MAIVVGAKATLVVDTGLGRRNGAFIAGEVAKLRKSVRRSSPPRTPIRNIHRGRTVYA
jgi:hypothetical protein